MMCWPTCLSRTKVATQHECAIDLCVNGAYLMTKLQTVVELPEFQRRARAVMSDDEREAAIVWIAENPEAGTSLGGGLRKVRIPREGGGKRGGFRTIYVFGGRHMPIFLVTVFAKNDRANLTPKEQAAAVELSKEIVNMWSDKQ